MRELLITRTNKPVNIEPNAAKNVYIKTLLVSGSGKKISIELSPNSDFNSKLLAKLGPQFCSVTWLGTRYFELPVREIPAVKLAKKLSEQHYSVLLHLAGRNLNKARVLEVLNELKDGHVKYILAIQGDWPHVLEKDDDKCDFPYASNLVSFIKENFGDQFSVGVAGYPDTHPNCKNVEEDIKNLYEKVSLGADFIITQATFEYEVLENFAKICEIHNIHASIFPGIFVIKSYKSLINMAKWCQFNVPKYVIDFVEKNKDNDEVIENFGVDLASKLIRRILDNKELFAGVHIFSMNDMELVERVTKKFECLNELNVQCSSDN